MKSIKTLSLILAIAAVQLMTSCLGKSDDSYKISNKYPNLFNAVLNQQTGEITLYPGASAQVDLEYGNNTAAIQINGLKLPDGASYPALTVADVPFGFNTRGWLEINAKDVQPTSSSNYVSNLLINKLNFQTASRQYNNMTFPPCVVFTYTINNTYTIYCLPLEVIEMGETVVTDQSGNQYKPSNSDNLTIYYIELDAVTKKGYVVIQGAKFADKMPAMNMKFPNIPFEVNAAGNITMDLAELEPTLMGNTTDITSPGTPAPNFPITNFRASFIPDYGLQVSYNCTPTGKDGQPMGMYSVQFKSIYPTSTSTTN